MELMQYFSKNFFSKIFPIRYFQRKTDGVVLDVVSKPLHLYMGNVLINPVYKPVTKLLPTIGGGYPAAILPKKNIVLNVVSKPLVIHNSNVELIVKQTWDTEEDIICIINILFNLSDNFESEITNNYINDDEEEIAYILSMIDW